MSISEQLGSFLHMDYSYSLCINNRNNTSKQVLYQHPAINQDKISSDRRNTKCDPQHDTRLRLGYLISNCYHLRGALVALVAASQITDCIKGSFWTYQWIFGAYNVTERAFTLHLRQYIFSFWRTLRNVTNCFNSKPSRIRSWILPSGKNDSGHIQRHIVLLDFRLSLSWGYEIIDTVGHKQRCSQCFHNSSKIHANWQ